MKATMEDGTIIITFETEEEIELLNKNRKKGMMRGTMIRTQKPRVDFLDDEGCYLPDCFCDVAKSVLITFPLA